MDPSVTVLEAGKRSSEWASIGTELAGFGLPSRNPKSPCPCSVQSPSLKDEVAEYSVARWVDFECLGLRPAFAAQLVSI